MTYGDFERYGVRRKSIPRASIRLCALGLIKRTRIGPQAYGEEGEAAEYDLTFYATRTANNNVLRRSDDWSHETWTQQKRRSAVLW